MQRKLTCQNCLYEKQLDQFTATQQKKVRNRRCINCTSLIIKTACKSVIEDILHGTSQGIYKKQTSFIDEKGNKIYNSNSSELQQSRNRLREREDELRIEREFEL